MSGRLRDRRTWVAVPLFMVLSALAVLWQPASAAAATPSTTQSATQVRCGLGRTSAAYHGTDAGRDLKRAIPDPLKVTAFPCPFDATVRGIELRTSVIRLVAAGKLVRAIPFPQGALQVKLPQIVRAVNDPTWISMDDQGTVVINGALIQGTATSLLITAPVKVVRLVNTGHASISGSHAKVTFDGVEVTSWDPAKKKPVATPVRGRPFVLYENGSVLDIKNSTMAYLGSDLSSSYGVSWRVGGTTGRVTGSTFEHNFFGVYTYSAEGIVFEHNTFRNNFYYGMDPHTYSKNLVIRYNNVYGNKHHGIVFSAFVTGSLVEYNNVHDNVVNGIMMDYRSDGNIIRHNTVTSNGQGIVFSASSNTQAYDNVVTSNRVGVRASHDATANNMVRNNTINGGVIGIKLYGGASEMKLVKNKLSGQSVAGIVVNAPRTQMSDNVVSGRPDVGINIQTVATLTGGSVTGTKSAIEVGDQGYATISSVVAGGIRPIAVVGEGQATLTATSFHLPIPSVSSRGLTTLDVLGISFLIFAIFCELVHVLRGRQLRQVRLAIAEFTDASAASGRGPAPLSVPRRLIVRSGLGNDVRDTTHDDPNPDRSGTRRFRPDIEGLRAVAVIAVVLSHASLGLPGGFVGVDVFFVISGFLITRQLTDESTRTGRISFRRFYARRARRILPAATLVTVATTVMSALWASPLRLASIAGDAIAAAVFGVNWRLASNGTDYFQASAPPSPFQQYWSLSVEEQFYVVWPVLLVLVTLLFRRRFGIMRPLLVALGLIFAASLWLSITVTHSNQPFAYFGTHTRAWELAAGAILAVVGHRMAQVGPQIRRILSWAGLVAIVASCVFYGSSTDYPGAAALLPVLGAVLVICGGFSDPGRWSAERTVLARRPVQWVGKVSYSLYLWHWPLLILAPDLLSRSLSTFDRIAICALAVVAAGLTFVLVERPIRERRTFVRHPARAGALAVALIATSVITAVVMDATSSPSPVQVPATTSGQLAGIKFLGAGSTTVSSTQLAAQLAAAATVTTLPADVAPPLAQAHNAFSNLHNCEVGRSATSPQLPCNGFGDISSKTNVVLVGDSHAGMWVDALSAVAAERHWRLTVLTKTGCAVGQYLDLVDPQLGRTYTECNTWRTNMIAAVEKIRPAMVIIGSESRTIAESEPLGLSTSIGQLARSGAKVAFLADTPSPRAIGDIPDCLATHASDISACNIPRDQAGIDASGRISEIQGAQRAGATVIDPTPWMCTQQVCPVVIDSEIAYTDASHITGLFGLSRAPELSSALAGILRG